MVKSKHHLLNPNPTNPCFTPNQTEMEKLEAWIRHFVLSFSNSKLRSVLSAARFLRRPSGAWEVNRFKIVSGLAIVITCDTWVDYRQLVVKNKQLSYRIRTLDPEVDLLMLLSPDETIIEVTLIATLERFTIERLLNTMPGDQTKVRTYTHPHRLAADK
ncbi:hypothetical protein VB735_14645 [Halotia wernerae UHCC 0503]|nr:hypothetical protein [Halotia wernerae UHCC 0503]